MNQLFSAVPSSPLPLSLSLAFSQLIQLWFQHALEIWQQTHTFAWVVHQRNQQNECRNIAKLFQLDLRAQSTLLSWWRKLTVERLIRLILLSAELFFRESDSFFEWQATKARKRESGGEKNSPHCKYMKADSVDSHFDRHTKPERDRPENMFVFLLKPWMMQLESRTFSVL